MNRRIFVWLLLLTLLLSACSQEPETPVSNAYTVSLYDMTFTVDQTAGTIRYGDDLYRFSVDFHGAERKTTITYPDGSTYYWSESDYGGHGGWSDDYDQDRYVRGDILMDVLNTPRTVTNRRTGNPLLGFLCVLLGIVNLVFPQLAWFLRHGWAFRDAEPSSLALGLIRCGGAVAVIIGIILVVV